MCCTFFFIHKKGFCICGFSSGLFDVNSQEIVLKYPRGYKAIKFRMRKRSGEWREIEMQKCECKRKYRGDGEKERKKNIGLGKRKRNNQQKFGDKFAASVHGNKSEVHRLKDRKSQDVQLQNSSIYIFRFKGTLSDILISNMWKTDPSILTVCDCYISNVNFSTTFFSSLFYYYFTSKCYAR